MADKTVEFRPFPDRTYRITGSEHDAGVVGELDRSGGRYQDDLALLLRRRVPPDGVAVDGGAHVGVLTVLLSGLCQRGRVYAFEPAPETHAYLVRNLEANGVTNAQAEQAALFDRDGVVAFGFNAPYPAGSHVTDDGEGTSVPSVRLDSWAAAAGLRRLDLLKLDLEGAEVAALDGAEETIRRLRPLAVVECNPFALRRFGHRTYRDLLARMRQLFASVGFVAPGGEVLPILSGRHLALLLADRGIVDLVGSSPPPGARERARSTAAALRGAARLLRTYNRWRPAPETIVVDTDIDIVIGVPEAGGAAAGTIRLPVTVTNRTGWWLTSTAPCRPVHVAYRWLDESGAVAVAEGHRTPFPEPVGP
ncbi:MAG TPA: FkbM family methyltransferase, partial [Acidimicrobiia bacterium]|nr:FkbM family methyltransferase [Acidimicrobiia bacterium]